MSARGPGEDKRNWRHKGESKSVEEIQKAIEERDKSDQTRTVGPLKPAEDAIIIDTTDLSIEEVVEKILGFVKTKCLKRK